MRAPEMVMLIMHQAAVRWAAAIDPVLSRLKVDAQPGEMRAAVMRMLIHEAAASWVVTRDPVQSRLKVDAQPGAEEACSQGDVWIRLVHDALMSMHTPAIGFQWMLGLVTGWLADELMLATVRLMPLQWAWVQAPPQSFPVEGSFLTFGSPHRTSPTTSGWNTRPA